ncbi:U3 small nucleolar RNA-associated protein 4 [Entomortierella parvispora]|uniref:U3 small nucleolar RNA-associated protein 4 n=1 Tax=Entomortierella parvispora TaxID=205924 RepID=A0A9P3HJB1_9FUNG|nr:U3 small nucleolar RNA-associated protein 4 [Entomortierella parvispora]
MEVHRCRFVDYVPAAINALTFTPTSTRPILACGRANGDIELWNPKNDWTVEKIIPGGKNTSVEALAWAHQTTLTEDEDFWDSPAEKQAALKTLTKAPPRLFSAGLNAVVTEWDTTSLKPKRSVDSHGGAVWCMATNHANTILAVGCEDGCLRLFDIADGELTFLRSFDKQKTRILSLAWSPDDKSMVTGSANSSMYKWNVELGRVVQRMTVDRVAGEDTLVWAVKVLPNGDMVSGDSLGHVKFWDATTLTMTQSFNSHGADVLCLAVGRDGTSVFSSGVDRKCNQYRLVNQPTLNKAGKKGAKTNGKSGMTNKWVLAGSRVFHSHDVRALALEQSRGVDTLVSGGVDVSMVVCAATPFPDINQHRLPHVPQRPVVSISKSKRLMLCRQEHGVKVWRLGKSAAPTQPFSDLEIGAHMDLIEPHQAILDMTFKDDHNLTASAISEDGHWISVATIEEVKLFRIDESTTHPGQLTVKKQKSFPGVRGTGAHCLTFTPDGARLIVASTDSRVIVMDLSKWETGKFDILRQFGQHRGSRKISKDNEMDIDEEEDLVGGGHAETIVSMTVSADGLWLATGDLKNGIFVFNLDTLQLHATLPKFDSPLTGLHFHPYSPTLVIPTANNVFYLFNVETRRLTDWSREYSSDKRFPKKFLDLKDKILGVAFNPARKNTLLVWGATYICHVDLEKGAGDVDAILNVGKRKRVDKAQELLRKQAQERRLKKYAALGIEPMPELETGKAVVVLNGNKSRKVVTAAAHEAGTQKEEEEANFLLLHKFQPLLFVDFVGDNSMVAVELPFVKILSTLPPSYYRASYGT